jgi:uncharacterized surface protein with fasciclin (FAS1) repeats
MFFRKRLNKIVLLDVVFQISSNSMKKQLSTTIRMMSLALIGLLFSASLKSQTVLDIVASSTEHNTLEAAVVAADLGGALSAPGNLTLFAPTDAAFSALPAGTVDALLADPTGDLTQILLYHVVGAEAFSNSLSDDQMIMTLQGQDVTVTINGSGVFINNAQVTVADIDATNGVVHVIDAVLLPELPTNTVVDIIVNSPDHNTLEAAVIAAGLVEALSAEGPFTVFAPTDAAFNLLPPGTIDVLLADPTGLLTEILFYHVVSGTALSTDLSDQQEIVTLNGLSVTVTINGSGVFINDAQVIVADILADNGVVHVIDAVLIPTEPTPTTVFDIISGSDVHNTLEAGLVAAGLDQDLTLGGPFTVFAPTDAAFDLLPAGVLDALLADPSGDLTSILLYHVLSGTVLSTDLSDGQTATTLLGEDITVTINGAGVFINDAQVIIADLVADNGVVHVIDAILMPTPESNTVVDIIVNSPDHNTLEAAVIAAGLVEALSAEGPFTVFAPTDAAFNLLPAGTIDALLADPTGLLTEILFYHVVSGTALSTDLSDQQEIVTLNGLSVTVTINGSGVFINDAQVIVADIIADNGVVHVIDAVLIPTEPTPTTVFDIISASDVHNTLEAGLVAAGLDQDLTLGGPFTVFAPTDAAFDLLPAGVLDALLADPSGDLTSILLYHVLSGTVLSTDLSDGQTATTLLGEDITVTINGAGVFINDAQVIIADLVADNGVVHVIDAILMPATPVSNTVVDIIVNSEVHNTLEAAVVAAGLVETLSGAGPFTVFAPTDAAFNLLPAGTIDALLADPAGLLTEILFYHVVSGTALSTDLSDQQEIVTLNGLPVTVTINGSGVFINDAQVIIADIIADNGVVHVIDAVLIPTEPTPTTVFDIIANSAVHTTLEAGLIAAGLNVDLTEGGPFTVFAPTDAAFDALPAGVLDALLADPSGELTSILLYHVLSGTVLSTDLTDGQTATTLLGEDITVTINGSGVFINDAQVIIADLVADNGVVHVIDAILTQPAPVPATVWDIIVGSPDHTILETAVLAAGLDDELSSAGPFTVFAPTDDAFTALPAGTIASLLANPTLLTSILLYHVASGNVLSGDLSDGQSIETLQGESVEISIMGSTVSVNDATVIVADLIAENGVVHVIDGVLSLPVGINESEEVVASIFPNPTVDQLTISLTNVAENTTFQIIDFTGKVVEQGNINSMVKTIDTTNLAAGNYVVRVFGNTTNSSINFIKL